MYIHRNFALICFFWVFFGGGEGDSNFEFSQKVIGDIRGCLILEICCFHIDEMDFTHQEIIINNLWVLIENLWFKKYSLWR